MYPVYVPHIAHYGDEERYYIQLAPNASVGRLHRTPAERNVRLVTMVWTSRRPGTITLVLLDMNSPKHTPT